MPKELKVGHSSRIMGDIQYGERIKIGELVVIRGPVTIGDDVTIKDSAYIGPNTILGNNCLIGPHAVIGDTTFQDVEVRHDPDHLYTSEKPEMTVLEDGVIIGANTTVKAGVVLVENTILLNGGTDIETQA